MKPNKERYVVDNTPAGYMIWDERCLKFANSYPFPSEEAAIECCSLWNAKEKEKADRAAMLAQRGAA